MKFCFPLPHQNQIQDLLRKDPLRDLKIRKEFELFTHEKFTAHFIELVSCSRFDPRITELSVEQLILFSNKLDLESLNEIFLNPQKNQILGVMIDWAYNLKKLPHLNFIRRLCKSYFKNHSKKFEAFYFDLYEPSSNRTQNALKQNPHIWEKWGFWAVGTPYSKEILGSLNLKNPPVAFAPRCYNFLIEEIFKENKFLSISQIQEKFFSTQSTRQLQRILRNNSHIKIQGTLKGTRYSYKK